MKPSIKIIITATDEYELDIHIQEIVNIKNMNIEKKIELLKDLIEKFRLIDKEVDADLGKAGF